MRLNSKRYIVLGFIIVMETLSIGCSPKPSASTAQAIVKNIIQNESNGLISLVDLKKTNAQEGEMIGVKLYALEYEAVIEFGENCFWQSKSYKAQREDPGYWGSLMTTWLKVNRGQRTVMHGKLQFEKMEKGWRCQADGRIY